MQHRNRLYSILLLALAAVLLLSACAEKEQFDKAELTFYLGSAAPVEFELTDTAQIRSLYTYFTEGIQVSTPSDAQTHRSNQPAGGGACRVVFYRKDTPAEIYTLYPYLDWWIVSTPGNYEDFEADSAFYFCEGLMDDGAKPSSTVVTELFLQLKAYADTAGFENWCNSYPWLKDGK